MSAAIITKCTPPSYAIANIGVLQRTPFKNSETNIFMLELRLVTVRVLVVLSGSFMSQIEMGVTWN